MGDKNLLLDPIPWVVLIACVDLVVSSTLQASRATDPQGSWGWALWSQSHLQGVGASLSPLWTVVKAELRNASVNKMILLYTELLPESEDSLTPICSFPAHSMTHEGWELYAHPTHTQSSWEANTKIYHANQTSSRDVSGSHNCEK